MGWTDYGALCIEKPTRYTTRGPIEPNSRFGGPKPQPFDRRWVIWVYCGAGDTSLIGWLIYFSSRDSLISYLGECGNLTLPRWSP
jgi:hypothetical protein